MADTITFTIAAGGASDGKIMGITVKDVANGTTFNWVNGVWDNPNIAIVAGVNNLSITITVKNMGNLLNIINTFIFQDDIQVGVRAAFLLPGDSYTVESITTMPSAGCSIRLLVQDRLTICVVW